MRTRDELNLANIYKQQILNEVRYLDPMKEDEPPISDEETIRVYHGFRDRDQAFKALTKGLSGKSRADRTYSYEFVNNPKGLFVTIDFDVAKEFGSSGIIIEFTSKISDLEAPVWKGGRYFVQGEYTSGFKDESEREEER
jgi:hypothetical protein